MSNREREVIDEADATTSRVRADGLLGGRLLGRPPRRDRADSRVTGRSGRLRLQGQALDRRARPGFAVTTLGHDDIGQPWVAPCRATRDPLRSLIPFDLLGYPWSR